MTDPLRDPLLALHEPVTPVDPDPDFAAELRARLERAVLAPERGAPVTTTAEPTTEVAALDQIGHDLTPYIGVSDGRRALDWYVEVFDARRRGEPYLMADGGIGHAELVIGDSVLMLAGGPPGGEVPEPVAGYRNNIHLQVPDVDASVERAVAAGAELERPPGDNPYGRVGVIVDPFGHRWMLNTPPAPQPSPGPRHGEVGYLTYAVRDAERAKAFYGAVLGWRFGPGSVEEGWQIEGTAPMSGLHGGQEPAVLPLFHVDDMEAALAQVRSNGGRVLEEPVAAPYGLRAECADDQGARFWLLRS